MKSLRAYYRYWDEKNHIIRAELIGADATDEEANDAKGATTKQISRNVKLSLAQVGRNTFRWICD